MSLVKCLVDVESGVNSELQRIKQRFDELSEHLVQTPVVDGMPDSVKARVLEQNDKNRVELEGLVNLKALVDGEYAVALQHVRAVKEMFESVSLKVSSSNLVAISSGD